LDLPYSKNDLKRVYEHKPCFDGMNKENFIGAETCMWSELVPNVNVLKRRAFPRLLAVAEGIWNGSANYDDFIKALKSHRTILARYGVKNTPRCKYEPKGLIKLALNLWWARRVLYWDGLQNLITNAKIEKLSKRR
ncbi:MAG: family 20 glycosylhydrolase, partial [Clostridia bacterium]|nr:family 20 glycosylhydrolase [Clostridia bacterium]